ncbi:MAG: hypothetical protein ACJ8DZ_05430 [Allosphingosinicella sp.]
MKKLVALTLAAATAAIATPAAAQTVASGTVTVTGTVAAKCTTNPNLDASITLGELALANGTVDPAFSGAVGGLSRSFSVVCTSSSPILSVEALPLLNAAIVTPTAGYTNRVNYTATLTANKAPTGSASAVDLSATAGATTQSLAGHLLNAANNVTIAVSTGATVNAADLLEAGSYAGSILISVAPGA